VNYYHGKNDAERIVHEIEEAGGEARAIRCDISQEEEVKHFIEAVVTRFGRIDVLVNNAVGEFTSKSVLDLTWEDFLQEMEVSVKGLHVCCQAVIPKMKELGRGKIINMSTVALDNPVVGQSRYITAKSAVVGYTKSLAKELAQYNIQVNLVVPNMTDTDLVSGIPSAYKEKMAASNPYKRHVMPIEVAQSIAFLASNWSNAMTGQKLVLNLGEVPFA